MNSIRKVVLGILAGGTLLGSSCLGNVPWRAPFRDAALYTDYEYLSNNDTSILNIDFFDDGNLVGGAG